MFPNNRTTTPKSLLSLLLILLPLYNNVGRIYLRRLIVFFDFLDFFAFLVFLDLRFPPLNTVIGGLYTPVAGSIENWRAISILELYLLRVLRRPFIERRLCLRDFFDALRCLRVFLPPFNGIPVG